MSLNMIKWFKLQMFWQFLHLITFNWIIMYLLRYVSNMWYLNFSVFMLKNIFNLIMFSKYSGEFELTFLVL